MLVPGWRWRRFLGSSRCCCLPCRCPLQMWQLPRQSVQHSMGSQVFMPTAVLQPQHAVNAVWGPFFGIKQSCHAQSHCLKSRTLQCSDKAWCNTPGWKARSASRACKTRSRRWSQTCWLPRRPLGCWIDRRRKPCKGYTVPACSDGGEGHLPLWGLGFLLPCCLTPVSRRLALQHLQVRNPEQFNPAQWGAALLLDGDKLTPAGR